MIVKTARRTYANPDGDFRFEAEMAVPVARWLHLRGLIVKSEFLLPWGVCDLVAVKLDPERTKRRLAYGQTRPIGSLLRLLILSRIPDCETGKSIGVARLSRELGNALSRDVLVKEIAALTRAKFVRVPRRGFLQKLNGWAPLHAKVVAVELKLTRVSEAVSQAVSNREFATHSYVAFPMKLALRVAQSKRADVFIRSGVGLLGVSARACREVIKTNLASVPRNPVIQAHVVERFWRTRDS
jgi:hypothetical protein